MKLPLLTCAITLAFSAQAQMPQLVHDIFPGTSSSGPKNLAVINGKLLFSARDTTHGVELRSYDGVNPPTVLLDMWPGYSNGFFDGGSGIGMAVMNNKYYFTGVIDISLGGELMVYDGINPPSMVADISPGQPGSLPQKFATIGNKIYFEANGNFGKELYIYDGVNAPVIVDVNPSGSSFPYGFTELNGKIYFAATTTTTGLELFCYDPITNIATVVTDISPGQSPSQISNITKFDNKLYFTAYESNYGTELWSFDGTTATRLTDLTPGAGYGLQGFMLKLYNGALYFGGLTNSVIGVPYPYKLYKYDLTTNTTSFVSEIQPLDAFVYANKLYILGQGGSNGFELWVHDGANTTLTADLNPGGGSSYPRDFCLYNNRLYFSADNGTSGVELFSFTDPLNITNASLNGDITLSPNPTTDNATLLLSLKASSELSITITDALGKLIWEKAIANYPTGNTNVVLPVLEQSAGIYFYNVKDNSGKTMASGKLQKQ